MRPKGTRNVTADNLPPKTKAVYRYIVRRILAGGSVPTVREVGEEFGDYNQAAAGFINALVRHGWLEKTGFKSRSLRVPGLKIAVEVADDEAGRRLRAALGEAPEPARAA